MAEQPNPSFHGEVRTTVKESTPWWPPQTKAPLGRAEYPRRVVRRCRLLRFRLLRLADQDANDRSSGCAGAALHRLPHHRHVLDHAGGPADGAQSPLRRVGCLANFDSGFPGYRGKIAKEAGTLAEMLKPHAYRNYMVGKWHVTPLDRSRRDGSVRRLAARARLRSLLRIHGCRDRPVCSRTRARQFEHRCARNIRERLPSDRRPRRSVDPFPGRSRGRAARRALAPVARARARVMRRIKRPSNSSRATMQSSRTAGMRSAIAGLRARRPWASCPQSTRLPPRNDGVQPWDKPQRRRAALLHPPAIGLCGHARSCRSALGPPRRVSSSRPACSRTRSSSSPPTTARARKAVRSVSSTLPVLATLGTSPFAEKLARIDEIGGPKTHSNFPHGWAMAANTPLRRYKQNTHGGGIRDPLVISWPQGVSGPWRAPPPVRPRLRLDADASGPASASRRRRRSTACGRCRSRARALHPASRIRRFRRKHDRSISRCSATADSGTPAGRPSPFIPPAHPMRMTNGSCSISTRTSPKRTILRANAAGKACSVGQALVGRGREAQGAAARRPLS